VHASITMPQMSHVILSSDELSFEDILQYKAKLELILCIKKNL